MNSLTSHLDKHDFQDRRQQTSSTSATETACKLAILDTVRTLKAMGLISFLPNSTDHKVWEAGLLDMTEMQIRKGTNKAKSFTGFMTLPAFRELCHVSAQDLGLPDVHAAYREACMADGMRDMVRWSHPAVYHAGRETGWFDLRTSTEKQIFPLFKRNYEAMCSRVMNGETLDMPVQRALPPKVFVPASQEKARATLNSIKELLG